MSIKTIMQYGEAVGKVAKAMARDVQADDMDGRWTGLDAQDAAELTRLTGVTSDDSAWDALVDLVRVAYLVRVAALAEAGN
ncbi:hypothetical protein UFOVP124_60 [uncultured Caudovirales phage]|uniref:Uncharacterized protein n=1 Tax=uncultured Caudovirales phage TaxID=2100421 RepID=A0A6J5LCS1_9CAUD|nr:hypothetical protein UFOVP124_60 [uncultured Caudovirales phage]